MEWLADVLALRQEVDQPTLIELLKYAPDDDVRLMVAGAVAHVHSGKIPDDLIELWEDALITYKFKDHSSNNYHVSTALKLHPETIPKWFKVKIAEEPTEYFDGFSREAEDLMPLLMHEQRLELIKELPRSERAGLVARSLVDGDIDLFKVLLANPNTKMLQLDLLGKMRGDKWVEFITAALAAGWSVEDLVSVSAALNDGWSGPASQHFKRRMDSYAPGLKSSDPRIVKIAQGCTDIYRSWYERELSDEDRESVYGIDG